MHPSLLCVRRVRIPPRPFLLAPSCELEEFQKYPQGRVRKATAKGYRKIMHVLRKIGNSDNPEKMRTIICSLSVSEGRKELYANAYDYYYKHKELESDKIRFVREDCRKKYRTHSAKLTCPTGIEPLLINLFTRLLYVILSFSKKIFCP